MKLLERTLTWSCVADQLEVVFRAIHVLLTPQRRRQQSLDPEKLYVRGGRGSVQDRVHNLLSLQQLCNDRPQALFFCHGSQITIEGLSSVNCTLLFQNCAYVRISRVTIEVLGNAGIVAVTVHSINMSLVFIHILKGIGINLWGDVTGNCIFEEVEVTSLDSHSRAIYNNVSTL